MIDPTVDNEPAIRCYSAVGFRPVGVLRRFERDDDGWHDGLLMDARRGANIAVSLSGDDADELRC